MQESLIRNHQRRAEKIAVASSFKFNVADEILFEEDYFDDKMELSDIDFWEIDSDTDDEGDQ